MGVSKALDKSFSSEKQVTQEDKNNLSFSRLHDLTLDLTQDPVEYFDESNYDQHFQSSFSVKRIRDVQGRLINAKDNRNDEISNPWLGKKDVDAISLSIYNKFTEKESTNVSFTNSYSRPSTAAKPLTKRPQSGQIRPASCYGCRPVDVANETL